MYVKFIIQSSSTLNIVTPLQKDVTLNIVYPGDSVYKGSKFI